MASKTFVADCPSCSFPISGQLGETLSCPNCGISGTITGVEVPNVIFWGGIGFVTGYLVAKSKRVGQKLASL